MVLKGVMHVHSTHSYDGKVPLRELKELFVKEGLSFACMTEHSETLTSEAAAAFVTECRQLSDEHFIFIPGFEVPYKNAHVLHVGTTEFVCQFADAITLKEWREKASLVVLAHPVRNNFIVDEILEAQIDGVEIWNQQYEGKVTARPRSMQLLRTLRKRKPLIATGGLDLHRKEHFGSPALFVTAAALSETSILSAIKDGLFSIGNVTTKIEAKADWAPSAAEKRKSFFAILTIESGKKVNAILANLGVSLPKSLKRAIRSRV